MFFKILVPPKDRDDLRFLWFHYDCTADSFPLRMRSHIFGATSSPFVASYFPRRGSKDNVTSASKSTQDVVNRSFYVDDCFVQRSVRRRNS